MREVIVVVWRPHGAATGLVLHLIQERVLLKIKRDGHGFVKH